MLSLQLPKPARMAVVFTVIIAVILTALIWFKVEWFFYLANHAEELTNMELNSTSENILTSLEIRHYTIEFALVRISLVWFITLILSGFIYFTKGIKK